MKKDSTKVAAAKVQTATKVKKREASKLSKSREMKKAQEPKVTMPCRITIRFNEDQMKQITSNAASKGHKTSAYCRLVILGRKVRDLSPETRKYRQSLINLGNNLNQVAKHMNEVGANKADIDKAKVVIDDIKELKSKLI